MPILWYPRLTHGLPGFFGTHEVPLPFRHGISMCALRCPHHPCPRAILALASAGSYTLVPTRNPRTHCPATYSRHPVRQGSFTCPIPARMPRSRPLLPVHARQCPLAIHARAARMPTAPWPPALALRQDAQVVLYGGRGLVYISSFIFRIGAGCLLGKHDGCGWGPGMHHAPVVPRAASRILAPAHSRTAP